ncbi:Uma2 family endonuclease [Rippkaea orientalis]|uniref:Uma2 family endonuclease n=1 Tax=Rippkaea orientalis TaxID=2546366 RepID=UPI00017237AF|nr:Uma2 family endonuclease [Rippkaea orientalis]
MVQTSTQLITFNDFIAWYPDTGQHYELHDGVIVEMPKPTGQHSRITGFLIEELILNIIQMGKRGIWTIPKDCIVKTSNPKSGYEPDIIILNQEVMSHELRWKSELIIEKAEFC